MTQQIRTWLVWASFEVPDGTANTDISGMLREAFYGHEHFSERGVEIEKPDEDAPDTTVGTWVRIDAPASMTWGDMRNPLREMNRSLRYPYVKHSMVIHERPDDIDAIITARELRRGDEHAKGKENEPGRNQPALHTLTFYWVSTPAEGETRKSVPTEGTHLATFQSRGALAVPAVGDTVNLFSYRVKVVGRSFDYEYSDAYEPSDGNLACTEVGVTVYVETPLPRPFARK